ncbi:MAG: excinuclease ABC subunit UvrB [Planctomycetes bacterium]|nr:excinuclease ABC subunit UvrB [Planctomycetota bacterium]NOG54051.1 excinuclease ABC subunit UvrB [Planctomycetota bacterium]
MPNEFRIVSEYDPVGDQPRAIEEISRAVQAGRRHTTLMGATGTGKTFTMANVIARTQKPALVLSHNKTLAAQLYEEMKELFPDNAVSYFVSYYDYYQPEAYIPQRDIYIEKDSSRNDDLDRLRLAATSHLISRRDVIIVASVSCIFGLGSPEEYKRRVVAVEPGMTLNRREFLLSLADMQYRRGEMDLERGTYRVHGDVIDIHPAQEETAVRIELFGDDVESINVINSTTGEVITNVNRYFIFPAVQYMMSEVNLETALGTIKEELEQQLINLRHEGKLLEAQRLQARTKYDLEMIEEVGYCSGIENYSRHLDGRTPGSRPFTLLDYFRAMPGGKGPDDWLVFLDESHVTVPQVRGMFFGDQSRKRTLVNHGFRLPSALDNRPLRFEEFEEIVPQIVYVSATPGPYELDKCSGEIVEQVIRPTGLPDPEIILRPAQGQVSDLMQRCRDMTARGDRVLVTALTKRLCEDLTRYLDDQGLRVRYLHSEIDTLDRVEILRSLREGEYDILVGVNLLREGLDLPEVALVAILDADKTGFLRSATSLIQQMGRAARNLNSLVVMYADKVTDAMQQAIDETNRRREIQIAFNQEHGIEPKQVTKAIRRGIELELRAQRTVRDAIGEAEQEYERDELISILEHEMMEAAESLEFEKAARLRDQVTSLKSTPALRKVKRSAVTGRERIGPSAARDRLAPGMVKSTKKKR